MKKRFFYLLHCCCLFTFSISGNAQRTVNDDVVQLNLRMFEAKNISLTMEYKLYLDGVVEKTMNGYIVKNGDLLHQKIGEMEVIRNPDYYVTVFHDRKIVFVNGGSAVGKSRISKKDLLGINMDSLQRFIGDIRKKESGEFRTYEFDYTYGDMASMKIEFSTASWFTRQIVLVYRNKEKLSNGKEVVPSMEINFLKTEENVEAAPSEFSTDGILVIDKNGKISLAPAMKSYRLINNIPEKKK